MMAATLTTCERDHFSLTDKLDDAGLSPITGKITWPYSHFHLEDYSAGGPVSSRRTPSRGLPGRPSGGSNADGVDYRSSASIESTLDGENG